jgi:competence protein ComEC
VFIQSAGGARFTRDSWLQYWAAAGSGPMPKQGDAADGAIACRQDTCVLRPRPGEAALLVRKSARQADCRDVSVILSAEPARGLCPRPWPKLVDRFTVWRDGATAIWLDPHGARVLTDRAERGARPWVPPPPQPRHQPPSKLPAAALDVPD